VSLAEALRRHSEALASLLLASWDTERAALLAEEAQAAWADVEAALAALGEGTTPLLAEERAA